MLSFILPLYIVTKIINSILCPFCVTTIDTDLEISITQEMYAAQSEWTSAVLQTSDMYPLGCMSRFGLNAITLSPSFFAWFSAVQLHVPVEGLWIFDYFRYGTYKVYEASFYIDCMNIADHLRLTQLVENWSNNFSKADAFQAHLDIINGSLRPERFFVELKPVALKPACNPFTNLAQTLVKFDLTISYNFQPNSIR